MLAFVREYLVDLNATQAAIRAGYAKTSADIHGCSLLKDPRIKAAVDEAMASRSHRTEVRADRVLGELVRLAESDPAQVFGDDGALLPLKLMPEQIRRAISSMDVITSQSGATVTRIKFWDKTRALELLARHLGLLNDKLELSGKVSVSVNIDLSGKTRNAEVIDAVSTPKGAFALTDGTPTESLAQEECAAQVGT